MIHHDNAVQGGPGECPRCGDTVAWRHLKGGRWHCRSCRPPRARHVLWKLSSDGPLQRAVAHEMWRSITRWRVCQLLKNWMKP